MISEMYCVYDQAVRAFLPPFFCRSRGEAVRSFSSACNTAGHEFSKHRGDFVLFYVGNFDDSSGLVDAGGPVRVLGAIEVIVDDIFPPDRKIDGPSPTVNGRG